MAIGSSSICVLAVGASSASLTLTHEEADYYMERTRIVGPAAGEAAPTFTLRRSICSSRLPGSGSDPA